MAPCPRSNCSCMHSSANRSIKEALNMKVNSKQRRLFNDVDNSSDFRLQPQLQSSNRTVWSKAAIDYKLKSKPKVGNGMQIMISGEFQDDPTDSWTVKWIHKRSMSIMIMNPSFLLIVQVYRCNVLLINEDYQRLLSSYSVLLGSYHVI